MDAHLNCETPCKICIPKTIFENVIGVFDVNQVNMLC